MQVENAAARLLLADTNSADQLREEAVQFICANMAAVHTTAGYSDLSKELLMEVIAALAGIEGGGRKRAREDDGALTAETIKGMKVGQLRAELQRRGLDVSGVRAVLMQRLEAAEGEY